jgi:hypothetical protein
MPILTEAVRLLDEHRYVDAKDRVITGVTGALHMAACIDEWSFDDHARWRGNAVHRATQFYDEKDLDERTLPEEIKKFLTQWKRVRREHNFEILAVEKRVFCKRLGYAGTVDRIVRFTRGPWRGKRGILDIKTNQSGQVAPAAVLQVTGYGYAENPKYLWPRLAVCLRPDNYHLQSYGPETYTENLHDWFAALRVARWRQKYLIKGPI